MRPVNENDLFALALQKLRGCSSREEAVNDLIANSCPQEKAVELVEQAATMLKKQKLQRIKEARQTVAEVKIRSV